MNCWWWSTTPARSEPCLKSHRIAVMQSPHGLSGAGFFMSKPTGRRCVHAANPEGQAQREASVGLRENFPGDVLHQDGRLTLKGGSQIRRFRQINQNHSIAAEELHVGLIITQHPKRSAMLLRPKCCFRPGFQQIEVFCNAGPAFVRKPLNTKHGRTL